MTVWSALDGTSQALFRFGLGRPGWKGVGTELDARLTDDSNRASIIAARIALGTDAEPVAASGNIAFRNLGTGFFRNALNTGDIQWYRSDVNNDLQFGNDTGGRHVDLRGTADVRIFVGTQGVGTWLTSGLSINKSLLFFERSAPNPLITHGQLVAAGVPSPLLITAQGTAIPNTSGGVLKLGGGFGGGGTGNQGGSQLGLNNGTNTDVAPMVEATQLATAPIQRVSGLNWFTGLTAAQVPAGAGDLVTVIGDAGTFPTVDVVGGFSFYSDAGRPTFRFAGTDLRIDGSVAAIPGVPSGNVLNVRVNGVFYKIPLNV